MDYNSKEFYLFCNQEGHDNQIIEFICIYSECSKTRLCCSTCIQQHFHDPCASIYLVEYDVFRNLLIQQNFYCSYFFTEINEEMINQMLDQQIITFNLKNEKIGSKICIYQGICQLEASKFAISNNQQLIVVLDRQKLCMFQALNNQKIMRVIKVDEEIFSIKFSTSDQFLYLCQKDRIIQLDVQKNYQESFAQYQYDYNTELRCISDTKILSNYQKFIQIIDFEKKILILQIETSDKIKSIDFQINSNNIVVFNQYGIKSWNTSGQLKFAQPDYHYQLNAETNVAFFQNEDKIMTLDYSKIIIWDIDYINETLILLKIIVSPKQYLIRAYNLNENRVHFIINDFIAEYSLEQNKLKIIRLIDNRDLIDDMSEKEFQIIQKNKQNILLQDSIFLQCKKISVFRQCLFKFQDI